MDSNKIHAMINSAIEHEEQTRARSNIINSSLDIFY